MSEGVSKCIEVKIHVCLLFVDDLVLVVWVRLCQPQLEAT